MSALCNACINNLADEKAFRTFERSKDHWCLFCEGPKHHLWGGIVGQRDAENSLEQIRVVGTHGMLLPITKSIEEKCDHGLRVVSIGDGIGTLHFILNELRIKIDAYYSFEIDSLSIEIAQKNHPEIIQKGDIWNYKDEKLRKLVQELAPIDLFVAAPPCSDYAMVNHQRKGPTNPLGTGTIFYKVAQILHMIQALTAYKAKNRVTRFLMENVASMSYETKSIISNTFLMKASVTNASDYGSCMSRKRYFWEENLPIEPKLPYKKEVLQDFLNNGRHAIVDKIQCVRSNKECYLTNGRMPIIDEEGNPCLPLPEELEKLFHLPENYTKVKDITDRQRELRLSKGWHVPQLKHRFAALRGLYASVDGSNEVSNNEVDMEVEETVEEEEESDLSQVQECELEEEEEDGHEDCIRVTVTCKQMEDLLTVEGIPDSLRDTSLEILAALRSKE